MVYKDINKSAGVKKQTYLTDKDLVIELVGILAQPICHMRNPVPEVVHSIFTANPGQKA